MLRTILVENFLSYERAVVKFEENDIAFIYGDNGSGKSTIVEAIRFATYGVGRYDDLKDFIRFGQRSMKVAVSYIGIPNKKNMMVIERGIKSGAGYLKVWIDKVLVAKGGASPSRNSAQEFIDTALGCDVELFDLTSFFGSEEDDTLVKVRPAESLDTFQKLGKIEICTKIKKLADDLSKSLDAEFKETKAQIDVLKESISEKIKPMLQKTIKTATTQRTAINARMDGLVKRKSELQKSEDEYRTIVRAAAKSEEQLAQRNRERALVQAEVKRLNQRVDGLKDTLRRIEDVYNTSREELEKIPAAVQAEFETVGQLITRLKMRSALLSSGIRGLDKNFCPLCNEPLKEHTSERWKEELKDMARQQEEAVHLQESLSSKISKRLAIEEKIKSYGDAKKLREKELSDSILELEAANSAATKAVSDVERMLDRLNGVKSQLKGYDDLREKLETTDEELQKCYDELAEVNTSVGIAKHDLKTIVAAESKIRKLTTKCNRLDNEIASAKMVSRGFSRTEIPAELILNLRGSIQTVATQIYREFDNCRIEIQDIPGARPGIRFVLVDRSGERPYRGLSRGEKVMFFLAIRLAITRLLGADSKLRFLVLDEVTGNLSPRNNDIVTTLIIGVLRKFYTQVILLSHVPIREVATKIITVERRGKVSVIADEGAAS